MTNIHVPSILRDLKPEGAAFLVSPAGIGSSGALTAAYFRIREFAWFQHQSGILDQAAWESYLRPTIGMMAVPAVAQWWENASS